jgi:hypothetical protein
MKATASLVSSAMLSLLMVAQSAPAEQPQPGPPTIAPAHPVYTLDNVMIDHFQARGARLGDVLEALGVLTYNSTGHRYRPTFIVIGTGASARPVSMNISHSPLSNALARLADDTGLLVTHKRDSVIFSRK